MSSERDNTGDKKDQTAIKPAGLTADDRTQLSDRPTPTPTPLPSSSSPPQPRGAPVRRGDASIPDNAAPTQGVLADRVVEPGVLINNNYRIQRMLSAGGMGEVYKAENVFTGDPVALKIVLPSLASDDGIIQLFKREARILGQLNDSAIVRYHNFVLDQGLGRYCLIMEYIDGNTLWDQVDSFGPITPDPALHLIQRLAHGLGKAHSRGVTHRDLSPDNVMLRANRIEDAVLIDFGIARAVDFGEGTLAGRFAGKFKYVSPEQLGHYGGEIGPAADIYGMALMMAAILRGKALDMGSSAVEAVDARRDIPDLSGLPHEIYPLLQYMLEPDPKARPASMNEVAEMAADPTRIPVRYRMPLWGQKDEKTGRLVTGSLSGAVSAHGIELTSDSPFGPVVAPAEAEVATPQRPTRAKWLPYYAGGAALALLLAVGVWAMLRGDDAAPPETPVETAAQVAEGDGRVLPPRDLGTREGFLANFDLGACAQVQRVSSGMDSGKLMALSDRQIDFDPLLNAYQSRFDARPAVITRRIAAGQCPAVDFVRALQGRSEAPPVLSLDSERLPEGGTVVGRLREAQGRTIWLFLVAADGGVHDLSSRLQPQADGSFTFGFGLALQDLTEAAPQLIVALVSRGSLVGPTAAAAGAASATILPDVRDEITEGGGFAAADIAYFELTPDG
ncbi:serine/threonine-protein kinase [Paracoccus tegillarcae]|uniref:Serine/threonine protein kinase n=1 Tax=Paracoccus tegillarcae TaxID=1529068 RepID=A0A2K9EW67_9RHOB|nr:serine/threonine-protein kinase [Paracoccus tegillarcae]AUH33524.1 serine/threonine protein kinase [Paracoccus tegillarcae]